MSVSRECLSEERPAWRVPTMVELKELASSDVAAKLKALSTAWAGRHRRAAGQGGDRLDELRLRGPGPSSVDAGGGPLSFLMVQFDQLAGW
jgi:hypothetical protein